MNDQPPGMAAGPGHRGNYARAERERRFLLAAPPATAEVLVARRITDRYLTGTRLRPLWTPAASTSVQS